MPHFRAIQLSFALGFTLCLTSFAFAHVAGQVKELAHSVQGEYEVWVSSRPTPVTGVHHLNITVLGAAAGQIVPNIKVNLTLTAPGNHSQSYRAVPGSRPYAFEVDAPLTQPGRWHMALTVESPSGRAEALFSRRVFTPLQLHVVPVLVFATSLALMALLGFGNLDFRSFRPKSTLKVSSKAEKLERKTRSTPSL